MRGLEIRFILTVTIRKPSHLLIKKERPRVSDWITPSTYTDLSADNPPANETIGCAPLPPILSTTSLTTSPDDHHDEEDNDLITPAMSAVIVPPRKKRQYTRHNKHHSKTKNTPLLITVEHVKQICYYDQLLTSSLVPAIAQLIGSEPTATKDDLIILLLHNEGHHRFTTAVNLIDRCRHESDAERLMDLGLSFMEDTTLASRIAHYCDTLHPDEPSLTREGTPREHALLFRNQWPRIEQSFLPLTNDITISNEEEQN